MSVSHIMEGTALTATAYAERIASVRARTEAICQPLETEDYVVQSIPEVSPPKWHLAHTTWFWETFLLANYVPNHACFQSDYPHLFNSYYQSLGEVFPKDKRGTQSRPTVDAIYAYRRYVTEGILAFLATVSEVSPALQAVLETGINHEEQHQELLLADIKQNFFNCVGYPAYRTDLPTITHDAPLLKWVSFQGGKARLGAAPVPYVLDIEMPRHDVQLRPYALASRLVTNAEYLAFIEAGGYQNMAFWLSDGVQALQSYGWEHPLYWVKQPDGWYEFTLSGLKPLNPHAPVCHLSGYEALAYAQFSGARLPTEPEWENAAGEEPIVGNHLEQNFLHPQAAVGKRSLQQLFGDCWQWTRSAFCPYPGYSVENTGMGEYNGKFMMNQLVMRGSCCATPERHVRTTYRNFYYPHDRWQFGGIRLARDL